MREANLHRELFIRQQRVPNPAPPTTIKPPQNKRRSNCTINYSESSQSPLPTESSTPSNYSRRPSPRPHCDHKTSGTLQARTEPVITQTRLTGDLANSGDGEDVTEGCRLPVLSRVGLSFVLDCVGLTNSAGARMRGEFPYATVAHFFLFNF